MTAGVPGRVRVLTLGCRLNQSESEEVVRSLRARGIDVGSGDADADVVLVNTCTVTADASHTSRKLIRKAAGSGARVVVTGCYAVAAPDAVASLPGVEAVVPNKDKAVLADRLAELVGTPVPQPAVSLPPHPALRPLASVRGGSHVRQSFKVQTGCDEGCTYCIVPRTRGVPASRDPDEIVAGIRAQVGAGAAEIALCGVHLGKYGVDRGERGALVRLLRRILEDVPELPWLRLSSIEARWVDDDLLGLIAGEARVCKHLHVPLQAGDDRVLAEMGRPYDAAGYLDVVRRVRDVLGDDAGISADVLVGFPGEADSAFARTCEVVREAGLSKLHVFRFSPRDGTAAARRSDQVAEPVKADRARVLRLLGADLQLAFHRRFLGRAVPTMIERATAGGAGEALPHLTGTATNYAKVACRGPAGLVGRVVDVLVTEATAVGVYGDPVV